MDVKQEGIKVKGGWRCQTWWSLRLLDFIGVSNQACYLVAEFDNSDFIFSKIAALSTSIDSSLNVSACLIGVGNLMGQASPVQAIVMERWGIESVDMEVVQEKRFDSCLHALDNTKPALESSKIKVTSTHKLR